MIDHLPTLAIERFPALAPTRAVHGFVGRIAGVDVGADRATALSRLAESHHEARQALGMAERAFATVEQVHGNTVAILDQGAPLPDFPREGADGLVTNRTDVCLGLYVADCCAVYLVDTTRRAAGLVHAGKKGTELGIVPKAIETMRESFGTQPHNLVVQLSPCIRPPWYETDFAAVIVAQCRAAGVSKVFDDSVCTAANSDRYYSYRREKGRTGRMLALLALV